MTSPFSARRVAGVVFDIDGTLLDNMPFHIEAFEAFTAAHGLPPLTLEMRKWMDGRRNADIFPRLFERTLTEAEVAELSHEKESAYRRLSAGRLKPLAGLMRLVDGLDATHVPIALATSAPRENVEHTLRELELASRLTVIARSDEVAHGKPEPDVFLEAARKLGVDAARLRRVRGRADGRGRGRPRRDDHGGRHDQLPGRDLRGHRSAAGARRHRLRRAARRTGQLAAVRRGARLARTSPLPFVLHAELVQDRLRCAVPLRRERCPGSRGP